MAKISITPTRRLGIDELSGGVNYRDGLSLVKNNQLTDVKNMEYKNGMLRPRPGFACADSDEFVNEEYSNTTDVKIYTKKENYRIIDGETYFLTVIQDSRGLNFRHCNGEKTHEVVQITAEELPKVDYTCNIFQFGADIYCICSGYYEGETTPYYIFKVAEKDGKWEYERIDKTKTNNVYVPTVMINGKPMQKETTGDMFEGYSILFPFAKYVYDTSIEDSVGETAARFYLPEKPVKGSRIVLEYPNVVTNGVVVHALQIGEDGNGAECDKPIDDPSGKHFPTEDHLNLRYDGKENYVSLTVYDYVEKNKEIEYIPSKLVRNIITITVELELKKETVEKVTNMTFSEWFGGGSEGIYGGIHLFMSGNTNEADKSLVCWSDFNRPLYFSESGNAYVGDKAQRVTAFGKQGDNLFIFKEGETYATQYVSASSVTSAESVINQSVVDITDAEVSFPMTQVHGYIGCDCPDTVQLCRNRLVWANSDGRVYTLVSASQWTERSIFEVSDMVRSRLGAEGSSKLKKAISADYDGKYMLFVGNNIYVMDYNSYGYAHVASYTKGDDAQANIPWWVWDLPKYRLHNNKLGEIEITDEYVTPISVISIDDSLYMWTTVATIKGANKYIIPELFKAGTEKDHTPFIQFLSDPLSSKQEYFKDVDRRDFYCMATTKMFDFGGATIKKSVPKAEMCFGNNGGAPIRVTTITDTAESGTEIAPEGEAEQHSAGFFSAVAIRNENKIVKSVGYRIESEGGIYLGAISLTYKVLGGIN